MLKLYFLHTTSENDDWSHFLPRNPTFCMKMSRKRKYLVDRYVFLSEINRRQERKKCLLMRGRSVNSNGVKISWATLSNLEDIIIIVTLLAWFQ